MISFSTEKGTPREVGKLAILPWIINVIHITFLLARKSSVNLRLVLFSWGISGMFRCISLHFNYLGSKQATLNFRFFRVHRLEDSGSICYNINRVMIGWLVAGVTAAYSGMAEDARLTPQGTIESDRLIVTVQLADGGETAALNYTLRYDPEKLEPVGVAPGSAVREGEKSFAENLVEPGQWTMVVMGLNQRIIPDGNVAVVEFKLRGPSEEPLVVEVEQPVLSTWDGEEIPVIGGRYEAVAKNPEQEPAENTPPTAESGVSKTRQTVDSRVIQLPGRVPSKITSADTLGQEATEVSVTDRRQATQTDSTSPPLTPEVSASQTGRRKEEDVIRDPPPGVQLTEKTTVSLGTRTRQSDRSLTVEDEGLGEKSNKTPAASGEVPPKTNSGVLFLIWGCIIVAALMGVGMLVTRFKVPGQHK
ncbi:MAG: hypothetical protein KBH78_00650 [Candidatus Hydrogenedentes bacterium]|nr:hypothetical protein [Candidatus Hydrogenedentota bacterium]